MFGKGKDGQDVVSMTEREEHRRRAPLRLAEAYWQGLRGAEAVPLRSDIDPRGMENALEYAFLVERIAPSMAKFRVAGSHLSDLMGMQVGGMPVSTFIAPEDRDRFGQAVTRLFGDPAILRMDLRAEDGYGKPAMRGTLLLLPLRSDFGDVSRGLGVLVTDGRIGRAPRRFLLDRIAIEPVVAPGVVAPRSETTPSPTAASPAQARIPAIKPASIPAKGPAKVAASVSPETPSTGPASQQATPPATLPATPPVTPQATPPGLGEDAASFRPKPRKHLRLVVDND